MSSVSSWCCHLLSAFLNNIEIFLVLGMMRFFFPIGTWTSLYCLKFWVLFKSSILAGSFWQPSGRGNWDTTSLLQVNVEVQVYNPSSVDIWKGEGGILINAEGWGCPGKWRELICSKETSSNTSSVFIRCNKSIWNSFCQSPQLRH